MAVVVATGAGIPARFYERIAKGLADRGLAVLTFDYRGIGRSRAGTLKSLYAGTETWARLDFGAALATARALYPDLPVGVVAHSFGAMLIGAAPDAVSISRLVFFGPHTGFWGDYHRRWRGPLFLTWHVFMPIVTKIVGYFPGRALRLGEDLPRQFANDWARRRRPRLLRGEDDQRRFGEVLAEYGVMRAETLAISITDDAFAPPAAAERLLAMYPNLAVTRQVVRPQALGCRRLGHFGFIRRPHDDYFLGRAAAWLLQEQRVVEPAPLRQVRPLPERGNMRPPAPPPTSG